jgi:hypothetical protein
MPNTPQPVENVTMANAKTYFGKIAMTNYYQVHIGQFNSDFIGKLQNASWGPQISLSEFGKTLGLLCSDATLPTSTYATAEVKDNYMGVPQEFAHTRLYTDIDFTFYIDTEYKVLQFFEFWMNYVGGNSEIAASSDLPYAYRRFNWPENYKTSQLFITKFNRGYNVPGSTRLQYQLVNAFPKSVTSIPVAYGPSELMKVTVTMNYDRYVLGRFVVPKQEQSQSPEAPIPPAAEQKPSVPQPPRNRPRTRNEVLTDGFIR